MKTVIRVGCRLLLLFAQYAYGREFLASNCSTLARYPSTWVPFPVAEAGCKDWARNERKFLVNTTARFLLASVFPGHLIEDSQPLVDPRLRQDHADSAGSHSSSHQRS